MAYEMSGYFDVYADLPKDLVDMEAWDSAARVDIWEKVNPDELLRIGINIVNIAKQQGAKNFEHGKNNTKEDDNTTMAEKTI